MGWPFVASVTIPVIFPVCASSCLPAAGATPSATRIAATFHGPDMRMRPPEVDGLRPYGRVRRECAGSAGQVSELSDADDVGAPREMRHVGWRAAGGMQRACEQLPKRTISNSRSGARPRLERSAPSALGGRMLDACNELRRAPMQRAGAGNSEIKTGVGNTVNRVTPRNSRARQPLTDPHALGARDGHGDRHASDFHRLHAIAPGVEGVIARRVCAAVAADTDVGIFREPNKFMLPPSVQRTASLQWAGFRADWGRIRHCAGEMKPVRGRGTAGAFL